MTSATLGDFRSFLDSALSTLEEELIDSGLAEREGAAEEPTELEARGAAYEIKRAALAWSRVNLTAERERWDEAGGDAAEELLRLRTLLRTAPDPAAALLAAASAASAEAAAAEEARAQLQAVQEEAGAAAQEAAQAAADAAAGEAGALAAALAAAQEALRLERAARDAAEERAFAASEAAGRSSAAQQQELESLQAEAERALHRAREAEAEAARSAARAAAALAEVGGAAAQQENAERVAELRSELALKERALSRLAQELGAAKRDGESASRAAQFAEEAAEGLRAELAVRPLAGEQASLRAALEEARSRAAPELQLLRQQLAAAQAAGAAAAAESAAALSELREALQQRSQLVARLEEDLESACAPLLQPGGGASAPAAGGATADSSLLNVVVGQRERLRARVTQLEEAGVRSSAQLAASQATAAAREAEVQRLRAQLSHVEAFGQVQQPVEEGMGARLRRRAGRLNCLGARDKAPSATLADEAGAWTPPPASSSASGGIALTGRARLAVGAYAAALHILLLRQIVM